AEDTPEAIALVSPGREPMTYGQLFEQIELIIKALRGIGIGRNDRIAIALPNGLELAALFLGVSCAAISVPLNPSYREHELESYLSELRASALLVPSGAHGASSAVTQRHRIPVVELDSALHTSAGLFTLRASGRALSGGQDRLAPDHVALILHTSGTTSKPKRVPLTHRNLCASAYAVRDALELTSADRCLGVMPLFHIHGLVGGLLSSLAAGASFAATPKSDPSYFFDSIKAFKPTWYTAVPTFHQAILRHAGEHAETVKAGPLRLIRSSSAPLPQRVMTQLEEVFSAPVIEAYGMTEASHQITSNPLPPGERKIGSVGVPTRTEVAIVNEAGDFLAAGGRGEVVIRGANVTAGYEPQEANAESFINGWFCTGDLGYLDAAGYLFLTGRLKEIINRGGEKISPREIDETLLDHPDVLQAAAFATPHPSLGEDIAAVVVTREPGKTTEASLRDYLTCRVAAFKVPARVLIVDEIPKGPTGKINRKGLAEAFAERLQVGFAAPKNDLEVLLANIYAEVLKVPRIGVNDNFFLLGGDSLRAMQVISRVRSLFSVNLPIATLFLKTTVAELAEEIAALVEALDPASRDAVSAELRKISDSDSPLCAAAQRNQDIPKY
ncbi:MAG: AMP-binding protein, partial [Candidatus Binatia bacterium]